MSRKKTTDPDEPRAPISLRRIEVRTEMVPLTDEERVERLGAVAGIESEISAQEYRLLDIEETRKSIKTTIEAKTSEMRVAIREAHDGHKGSDYDVIVERHPDHNAEMMVWRCPDGVIASDLIAEEIRIGDTLIAMRERQGCSLVETRAMTSEEMDAAADEDHRRKNPTLPLDLDPPASDITPCDPETGIATPAEERLADRSDDEWESDPPTPITEGKKGKRGRKVA